MKVITRSENKTRNEKFCEMATRYRTFTSAREAFRSDVPRTSCRRNDQTSSSDVPKTSSGVHGSTSSRRPNKTSLGPVHDVLTTTSRSRISCMDGTKWFILYNQNVESKRQSVESKMGSLALLKYDIIDLFSVKIYI